MSMQLLQTGKTLVHQFYAALLSDGYPGYKFVLGCSECCLVSVPCMQIGVVWALQHVMLVFLTLPWAAITRCQAPWTWWDTVVSLVCATALVMSGFADEQLAAFVAARGSNSLQQPLVLRTGLWAYSRHPAHFSEQLWWWGVWMFSLSCGGGWWTVVGCAYDSLCMIPVR
jgi:steroid 5-alpha reductase family enzyme